MIQVTIKTAAGTGTVLATDSHPFWNATTNTWTNAEDLNVGDTLRDHQGVPSVVTATQDLARNETVHNLTVANLHSYYVLAGDTPVLVHNDDADRFRRPRYSNYLLLDRGDNVYYAGIFGPGQTVADVQYRHGKTHNRFSRAGGDTIRVLPGTRTDGEARLMEQRLAVQHGTIIGRGGNNWRGNRQNPIAPNRIGAYESFGAVS
jgi:hypothetical protein